jgi:integrase/recombinase XerD
MTAGFEEYLLYLRAKGYTGGTITWQESHLESFQSYLDGQGITAFPAVTVENIQAYLAYLKTKRKLCPRTHQAHLSAIKGLFAYLVRQGMVTFDPAKGIEPPKSAATLPEIPTEEEIARILAAPDLQTPLGIRNRAILEVLYSSGLRRQELINLNLSDVDPENGYLRVVQGKNKKDRMVPLGDVAGKFIEAYLKLVRWWYLRDPAEPALFIDSAKGKRLSPGMLGHLLTQLIKKTGITKKVTPHTFRHAMATHLLQNQADIRHIQMMLGHASVATTEIYTRLAIDDLKAVLHRAHPHGRRIPDSHS